MRKTGYIAVEGLIGAGKTTLAKRLAMEWNGSLVLEAFEENPFLPRFYADPVRHAFAVELSFLAQRYHQIKHIGEGNLFQPLVVADYSIGKSLIFASVTLLPDELALFRDLYAIIYRGSPKPDLILYLHVPIEVVRQRIKERGRPYEQNIEIRYLEELQERYLDHLQKLTGSDVLVVDIEHVDLLRDEDAYHSLLRILKAPRTEGHRVERL